MDFLSKFRRHNVTRAVNNFTHDRHEVWWTNAIAGEAGEACNIAKKISRGDFKSDVAIAAAQRALADELADVVTYCDLLLADLGYTMEEVLKEKFNVVSARVGYPHVSEW